MTEHELNGLFQPKGIAVIGASNNPLKAGCIIINNMIKGKFPGKLYPVNRSEENVAGLKTYARLSDIDDVVELVVLITPASAIYSIMDDLDERMASKNDVRFIVCAAADYAETKTEEGIKRQERLMQAKDKYGIRIIGPNCIGVIDTMSRVNTTFVDTGVSEDRFGPPGGISFISQSGSVAASILAWGASKVIGIRYNKFISVGNMADIDFIDLLEFLEQDPSTKVIGIYMEGYQNGKQLIKVMGRIARKKPIIILKVGRSSKGSVAANSHTSSMSGSDKVYDAAFRQYGILRVEDLWELLDTLQAFDKMRLPDGNRLFVLTQAGGPGIYCSDEISKYDFIETPMVSENTKNQLKETMPRMAAICVPEGYADITASATIRQHCDSLRYVLMDPSVDGVCFITVVTPFLPSAQLGKELSDTYWSLDEKYRKPVYFCIMAGEAVIPCRRELEQTGLVTFDSPTEAVKAAKNMIIYNMKREKETQTGQ